MIQRKYDSSLLTAKQVIARLIAMILLAAVILNVALVFLSPVNDAWYYLGDALCIAVLLFSSLGILRTYNVGTTRPLPRLFDRKEV